MRPWIRYALAASAAAVLVAVWVGGGRRILERERTMAEINTLREQLYDARSEAQACRRTVAAREREFRRFEETVDSLRDEVATFESLDDRGVPQEQYEEYLATFERYNDSVDAWEGRVGALQAADDACRAAVVRHNALRDSFEVRITAEGLADEG